MNEEILKLFEGADMSEDFKKSLVSIVENAVKAKEASLDEQVEQKVQAQVAEKVQELEEQAEKYISEEVMPNVDKYLTAAVNEWLEQNELAVEQGIKVEVAESLLSGMKNVFESNYIEVPEGKVDMFEEAKKESAEFKTKLDEETDKRLTAEAQVKELQKELSFVAVTESLADTDKERVKTLAEGIEFKSKEDYETRLKAVMESFKIMTEKKGDEEEEDDNAEEEGKEKKKGMNESKTYAQMLAEQAANCKF